MRPRRPRRPLLRRARGDPAARFDTVAETLERLAALLRAGAGAADAWRHLGHHATEQDRRLAHEVADALDAGAPCLPAFRRAADDDAQGGAAWLQVGLLLEIAVEAGAPLAPALDRAAATLRQAADLHRTIRAAVAGPAVSARIVLALPLAGVVLGWALGFDVPRVLFASGFGLVAVPLAALLVVGAVRWSGRLTLEAGRVPWQRGWGVEVAAVVVRAGLPPDHGLDRLARMRPLPVGVDLDADRGTVLRSADFAARGGVPLAALLEAEALRIRHETAARGLVRANALGARLLLPLGLLVLPAFVLVGVLPIGIAVLSSTSLPI